METKNKKILIVGASASAYSLAAKLNGYPNVEKVYVAPGKSIFADISDIVDIREDQPQELLNFVLENDVDLTVVCSETAIKNDIAGKFQQNNQQIFAPNARAGRIAFDKALAKKVLYKLRIPTPKFGIFEKPNMVLDYIKNLKNPFVLKTDDTHSAAAFASYTTAKNLVDKSFIEKNKKIIIEDYIYGTPFSFYAVTDGYKALPIGSSITYKHALEGDGGQLTSGMGACAPNYKLSIENEYFLMDNVIYPLLDYLEIEGNPYLGILGVNGILTEDGRISVLGWQSFMQDCDVAPVLDILDEDLYNLFESCVIGSFSDEVDSIRLCEKYSASLVLTNKNRTNTENSIAGLDNLDEETLITFYPSVRKNRYLEYEAADYGSVLALTSSGSTPARATERVYREAEDIKFKGVSYRKDICRTKV